MTEGTSPIRSFLNFDILRKAVARHEFPITASVRIPASRNDDDWLSRVVEMRAFCNENCSHRHRIELPRSVEEIVAHFEHSRDAVLFKLTFG